MYHRMTETLDNDAIRATVTRLARPRADGGHVIERAAIVAAGGDAATIESWILAHAGQPEEIAAADLVVLLTEMILNLVPASAFNSLG